MYIYIYIYIYVSITLSSSPWLVIVCILAITSNGLGESARVARRGRTFNFRSKGWSSKLSAFTLMRFQSRTLPFWGAWLRVALCDPLSNNCARLADGHRLQVLQGKQASIEDAPTFYSANKYNSITCSCPCKNSDKPMHLNKDLARCVVSHAAMCARSAIV